MDSEELEEVGRRYTGVPLMPDAFRTNAEGEVLEFSNVVELEDARTSEATRLTSDGSSVGLYRGFNGRSQRPISKLHTIMSMRPGTPSIPLARFPKVNSFCFAERFVTRGTTYD